MARQFWENDPVDCNDCRNMEREIARLESKVDLLEQANAELLKEIVRLQEPSAASEGEENG